MIKKLTYKDAFKILTYAFICYLLSCSIEGKSFFSVPFYVSLLYTGVNPVICSLLFIATFAFSLNVKLLIASLITSVFCVFVFSIYRKKNKPMGAEIIIYSAISLISFVFITNEHSISFKILEASICVVLTFVFISSTKLLFFKKFDYKCSGDEIICLAVFCILTGLGLANVFGGYALKSAIILIGLYACAVFNGSVSVAIVTVLSISHSVFTRSIYPLATFPLLVLCSSIFTKQSKLLSSLVLICVDLVFMLVFKVYGTFVYSDIFYTVIPVTVYLFTPNFITDGVRKKTSAFQEKSLSKHAINRMRGTISNRLYGIADVFMQIKQSFSALEELVSTDEQLLGKMADELLLEVCEKCPSFSRCKQKGYPDRNEIIKILSIGVAKNRISLIDLTKNFAENCGFVNGVIFEMNALIGKYREKVKESEDVLSGKELIKMQSEGVALMLKGLAIDYSKTLNYSSLLEKKLCENLRKKGIFFNELMVFNSNDTTEINLVVKNDDIFNEGLLQAVDECLNKKTAIVSKVGLTVETSAITIKPSPSFDAAFGLAVKTKEGSKTSGDTHALTKIDEGKFLLALSDGMGSGTRAKNTSSTAISLIESFYKAGLESNLILGMVNKILTLNTDDNFSAMDILTVNLFDLKADFIKIGAPYSFIMTDSSIKIIEGSSLPLGILDDLAPTGCSTSLRDGETIIMITDGVSDAFSSSTDLVEYIRNLDNKNPQLIADSILNRALLLQNGTSQDDMTVLAVRIFKNAS